MTFNPSDSTNMQLVEASCREMGTDVSMKLITSASKFLQKYQRIYYYTNMTRNFREWKEWHDSWEADSDSDFTSDNLKGWEVVDGKGSWWYHYSINKV